MRRLTLLMSAALVTACGDMQSPADTPAQPQSIAAPGFGAVLILREDLGTFPGGDESEATAINSFRQITGWSDTGTTALAFLWTPPGPMVSLGSVSQTTRLSRADDINDLGQVVGQSWGTFIFDAFLWTPPGPMVSLGSMGLGADDEAAAINELGHVVGAAEVPPLIPFRWISPGPMTGLSGLGGSGSANDINDLGAIVGSSVSVGPANVFRAFHWTEGGGPTDLGALEVGGQSLALAISNGGEIVGEANVAGQPHAVRWASPVSAPQDLGTLGGASSRAMDVNDAGTIVGESQIATGQTRGFRKTAFGGLTSLSTLGGDDSHAFGINAAGHTVGSAELPDGNRHAVAWWFYRIRDALVCVCRFPTATLRLSVPRRFSITILGTRRLPVSAIDARTITLGDNDGNDTPALPLEARDRGAVADRNGDRLPDLVVHFDQAQLMANGDLTAGTRRLVLMGALLDRSNAVARVWHVRVHP